MALIQKQLFKGEGIPSIVERSEKDDYSFKGNSYDAYNVKIGDHSGIYFANAGKNPKFVVNEKAPYVLIEKTSDKPNSTWKELNIKYDHDSTDYKKTKYGMSDDDIRSLITRTISGYAVELISLSKEELKNTPITVDLCIAMHIRLEKWITNNGELSIAEQKSRLSPLSRAIEYFRFGLEPFNYNKFIEIANEFANKIKWN
jgi:hypothetical protein